jgi:hypothetical protein
MNVDSFYNLISLYHRKKFRSIEEVIDNVQRFDARKQGPILDCFIL